MPAQFDAAHASCACLHRETPAALFQTAQGPEGSSDLCITVDDAARRIYRRSRASSHGYKSRAAFVVEQSQPQSRSAAGAGHESERRAGQGHAATDRGF